MPRRPSLSGRLVRIASLLGSLLLATATGIVLADGPAPKGVVYVQSNVAAGNAIIGYHRDAEGKLTELPGSPFPTGGAGISPSFNLGPYDSDSEIIANNSNTVLYATNGGSNSISAFRFGKLGALVPLDGSPFSSGGSDPVSLVLSGDKMVVVNQDNNPGKPGLSLPSYSTLQVDPVGALVPIRNASYPVDLGANPTQAYIPYDNNKLVFGCDFLGGVVRSFQLGSNGKLIPIDAQALPEEEFGLSGAPPFPLGLWSSPKARLLYVGYVTINRMGVYRYDGQGHFKFLRSVPNSGNGICWIRSNREGTRLYTSNTTDPSISVYDTSIDPSEPIEIQRIPLKGLSNAYQIALDPAEEWFYLVSQRNSAGLPSSANALHVLKIAGDGTLTEVDSSPTPLNVPASTRPQGVIAF